LSNNNTQKRNAGYFACECNFFSGTYAYSMQSSQYYSWSIVSTHICKNVPGKIFKKRQKTSKRGTNKKTFKNVE